jgi:DNA end-binding protein Ku
MARAIQSAILSFGLVSIPVKLYTAADTEGVKFNMITPKGNRVKQKWLDAVTGDEITQGDCSKGYEYAKDQFVIFSKDEIKALEAEKSDALEIKEFIPATAFDARQVEKSYYLGPDKGGDKGYVLLSKAMKRTGKVAVARLNSRGREHLIIVRPLNDGLMLHQMYYDSEIRDFSEIEEKVATVKFHEVEEEMADKLIESLSADTFDSSKYTDGYVDRVKAAVDQKINGQEFKVTPSAPAANITDLFAALKASLDKQPKKTNPS